jgi:amidase
MPGFEEYTHYDGLGLADLIRRREVAAAEVCEAAIAAIQQVNPRINAVVQPMFDLARRQLDTPLPAGPFAGVPFLLKDLLSAYAGVPLTCGSKALRDFVPDHDSELVRRYKQAGLVILGKTNTPEFGLVAYTEPELFGPTRNPWDPQRTPGGSSGGAAAAVASGMVPLAGGGDGGGSIRIPACYCGLFGLKPSRGRVPTGPDFSELWQGAAIEHVISRSVRDSAAALDAVQGPDAGAPYIIAPPERPFLEEVGRDPGRLRIAFSTRAPIDCSIHPEYEKAVLQTAILLHRLGHEVEEAAPELDGMALAKSYFAMNFAEVAAEIDEISRALGRPLTRKDVEITTWTLGALGHYESAFTLVKGRQLWGQAARVMGRFHERFDLFMTPTVAQLPARIGALKPSRLEEAALGTIHTLRLARLLRRSGVIEKLAMENLARTPFTQLANFTGQPAMSLPLHWSSDGLPCGVQFMAPNGGEAVLLRLAGQLEKECPWFGRRPAPAAS